MWFLHETQRFYVDIVHEMTFKSFKWNFAHISADAEMTQEIFDFIFMQILLNLYRHGNKIRTAMRAGIVSRSQLTTPL